MSEMLAHSIDPTHAGLLSPGDCILATDEGFPAIEMRFTALAVRGKYSEQVESEISQQEESA